MKNTFKFFRIIAVTVLIGLFTACGGGKSAYYGTWVSTGGDTWTISANKIVFNSGIWTSNTVTFENLNWLPVANTLSGHDPVNFPTGFEIVGKVTNIGGGGVYYVSEIGQTVNQYFYIHNNKGSISQTKEPGSRGGAWVLSRK